MLLLNKGLLLNTTGQREEAGKIREELLSNPEYSKSVKSLANLSLPPAPQAGTPEDTPQESPLLEKIKALATGQGFLTAGIVVASQGRSFIIERKATVQKPHHNVAHFAGRIEGNPPNERIAGRIITDKTSLYLSYLGLLVLIGYIVYGNLFHVRDYEITAILIGIVWVFFTSFHLLGKRDEQEIRDFLKALEK
jgi:hypothetical protein